MPNLLTSPKEHFYVLFADSFGNRHCEFRVRGKGPISPVQRHCHTLEDFKSTLPERKWDVIFIPSYWKSSITTNRQGISSDKLDMEEAINAILSLPEKPGLVIYHGLTDHTQVVLSMKRAGILAAHIPWDIQDMGKHERVDAK